jgi:hypothetical protein
MLRKLILAGAVALASYGGLAAPTPAQADVRIYLGVPFHPYRVGPGWRYQDGYGWYDYGRQREPVARSMAARWEARWGPGRARLEHDPPPPPREVEDGREQLALLPSLQAAPLDRHRAPLERRPRPADDAAPALPGQVALPLRVG